MTSQDETEDWGRWRDVVFRAKSALSPRIVTIPLPPQNKRKRGGPAFTYTTSTDADAPTREEKAIQLNTDAPTSAPADEEPLRTNQLTAEDVTELALRSASTPLMSAATDPLPVAEVPTPDPTPPPVAESASAEPVADENGMLYCPECFVPLHPDPKPESLYIFLHALKYTTSLGTFETQIPTWAAEGWEWER